jgi:gas vesicle protein
MYSCILIGDFLGGTVGAATALAFARALNWSSVDQMKSLLIGGASGISIGFVGGLWWAALKRCD